MFSFTFHITFLYAQVDVEEFFDLFFSNEGIGFAKDFHTKCGDDGMILFLINTTHHAFDVSK
jgi:hypothetical protein